MLGVLPDPKEEEEEARLEILVTVEAEVAAELPRTVVLVVVVVVVEEGATCPQPDTSPMNMIRAIVITQIFFKISTSLTGIIYEVENLSSEANEIYKIPLSQIYPWIMIFPDIPEKAYHRIRHRLTQITRIPCYQG